MPLADDRAHRVSTLLRDGMSPARLRSPGWVHAFWGVRSRTPLTPERAFAPRLGARAFLFGSSAARLHGLPTPSRIPSLPIHVGVPAGVRRPAARDVVAHHVLIDPNDVVEVDGIAATSIERTWCDLAAQGLRLGELVAVGDAMLRSRRPRTNEGRLRAGLSRYQGHRGARTLRAALPLLDGRADSPPESELRVAIITAGLPAPLANPAVRTDSGVIHLDLAWPDRLVAVEYEGDHHRQDRDQWHYDIRRYDELDELGWTVIRATAADYRDPARLLARLRRVFD